MKKPGPRLTITKYLLGVSRLCGSPVAERDKFTVTVAALYIHMSLS